MPERDSDIFYAPDTLVILIQEYAALTGEAFGRGLIDERKHRRRLRADRDQFATELAKTIGHMRLRTGQEVRESYFHQYFLNKLMRSVLKAREEVRNA